MNSREAAVEVVGKILNDKAYSNIVLSNKLNESSFSIKDRALITEIVYGTVKYKYSIDETLKHFSKKRLSELQPQILNILRTAVYQLSYLDKVPDFAAINEAVNMAKKESIGASKFVNGVLRNYLRQKDKMDIDCKDIFKKLSIDYSFPEWMVKLFIKQYGEDESKIILEGLNQIPGVTVRVNTYLSDYESVWEELSEAGYALNEGTVCPEAINISKGGNIEDNSLFSRGLLTVQDESAMLPAVALEVQNDLMVLDLCSAPGGKTTHISELMGNSGHINAYDIYENKLSLIKENAARLKLSNIITEVKDASIYDTALKETADRVLADVPCSGLGIIRKKPEIKWNKTSSSLNSLINVQREIISNGARYLKKGGIMVYSTCTLNKKENEENIKWFLEKFPEFSVDRLYFGEVDNFIYHKEGFLTIIPNKFMDGFFIAKLRKLGD